MQGVALGMAVLGCRSIEKLVEFYAGALGLDATPVSVLSGPAFERHWGLPSGASARAVSLSAAGSPVGRILGLEFAGEGRRQVVQAPGPFIGHWNMNFYVDGIVDAVDRLEAQGHGFWSRPVRNVVAGGAGSPTEAIFAGPDGVAINLLELDGPEGSEVARIRAETDGLPRSRTGFSQVATAAHATTDIAAAAAFCEQVLGMSVAIDAVLESEDVNRLTGRPRDGRTRVLWMRGEHPYGKIALSEPLNYVLADRTSVAVAPNLGLLAHSFVVPDLDRAIAAASACGSPPLSEPATLDLPGGEIVTAVMCRSPGSGALIQLTDR